MKELSNSVAIVGVDESDEIGKLPDVSLTSLHLQAVHNAVADAGLKISDVDGIFTAGQHSPAMLGEALGITPRYVDGTSVGGCSFIMMVGHAVAALHHGLCDVAVISHGESGRSGTGVTRARDTSLSGQYEMPYGFGGAPTYFGMITTRHMHEYGTTLEDWARVAVSTRAWAGLNPKAMFQDPITVEDVLNSPKLFYPFNLLNICLVTDAGGAVVLTSLERARDLKKAPVRVLGAGEAHTHRMISQMPDLTQTAAAISGKLAFERSGLTHADIDVAEIYDSFTITVLLTLESLGFCAKGEGGAFVANQRTAPGGDFPMNTQGGALSYTHPGMFGIFTVIEGVRQVRGECGPRQVPDARVALCNGTGGVLSSTGTIILGRD